MASFWGLIVALLALNAGFSVAQNATVTYTVIAATPTAPLAAATLTIGGAGGGGGIVSSQIVPTPTASVAPASTSASTPSGVFDTYLKVTFTANTCPSAKDAALNSTFQDIYKDAKFHLKRIDYSVTREGCHFKFTLTFGPKLKEKNIIEVLEAKLKSMENIVDGMTLSKITTEVHVNGLGEFKATDDECKKKCCEGAGGPITVKRTCTLSQRCGNYKLEKKVSDCMNFCSDKCPGVTMYKTSLLILLFGLFMNWFLK